MKTYTLHFIRHGMTTANEEGRYVGHQDLSLSLQGEDELRYLKDNCVYPDPPVVFTSPLKRCTETCEILFPDAQPVVMRESTSPPPPSTRWSLRALHGSTTSWSSRHG